MGIMMVSLFNFGSDSTPKRRTPCTKAVTEAVWLKYSGHNVRGKCYVCGRDIDYLNFEVGHNRSHKAGGKWNVNNLRPVCRTCNRSMGARTTIESFKKKHFTVKSKTSTEEKTPTKKITRKKTSTTKPTKRKTTKRKSKSKTSTKKTTKRKKTSTKKKTKSIRRKSFRGFV